MPSLNTVQQFGFDKTKNFLSYYTGNCWIDEKSFLFFADEGKEFGLFRCDITSSCCQAVNDLGLWSEVEVLTREDEFLNSAYCQKRNTILIPRGLDLVEIDLNSGRQCILASFEGGDRIRGPIACSDDERYVCGGIYRTDHTPARGGTKEHDTPVFVYDLEERKLVSLTQIPMFANHFQFFADDERILYAHEGATEQIPDRLNILEWKTGKHYCPYAQIHDESGKQLECLGHEMVAGNNIVVVRYPVSETDQFGLMYINPDTQSGTLIDVDDYWHSASDSTGKRFLMDTMWWGRASRQEEHHSDIVYFDLEKQEKKILCTTKTCIASQAYHPHPRFSLTQDAAMFAMQNDPSKREVKIGYCKI